MNQRLQHDAAQAMAVALLDIVENCIRPEERLDALQEFYAVCKAGIEAFGTSSSSADGIEDVAGEGIEAEAGDSNTCHSLASSCPRRFIREQASLIGQP